MKIRSKIVVSLLIASNIINTGAVVGFAYENANKEKTVVTLENKNTIEKVISLNNKIISNGNGANLTEELQKILNSNEGTAIIRFKTSSSGIQTLFSISNNTKTNEHFHVYINNGQIGYELRKQSGNVSVASKSANFNEGINTVAFRAEKNKGYSIFVNEEKVLSINSSNANFLQALEGANTFNIGKTDRSSGNEYNFSGEVDSFEFYNEPLDDTYLAQITGETKAPVLKLPEGAMKSDTINLFTPGQLGSNNFRIPSLFTTKAGTVLASIDVRKGGGHDSPNNIDSGIKRSTDGGNTWDEGQIIIDYPGAASAIDTSMVQDDETGRIFLLVTHFAEGFGYPNSKTGSGYKEIDGERYLLLFDKSGNEYTLRDNVVYDSNNQVSLYTVDENKNLYKNGVSSGHILTKAGDLQVLGTAFLSLIHSDDDGKTWSEPVDLNKEVKEDWMRFLGTGPGRGHVIKNGDYKGRIVFPIYLTNSIGFQSSGLIYSDDNGVSWKIGVFYEGTSTTDMMFTKMNLEYLKADLLSNTKPSQVSYQLDKDEYSPLDKISLTLRFDNAVSLIGNKKLIINVGEKDIELDFVKSKNCKEFVFEGTVSEEITSGNYEVILKGNTNLKITNVYNKLTDISKDISTGITVKLGSNEELYNKLETLINSTINLKEYLYTIDSWNSLDIVLNKAKDAIEKQNLETSELENLAKELEDCIENLTILESRKQLDDLLKYADTLDKSMMDPSLKYAEIKWENFEFYRELAKEELLDLSKDEEYINSVVICLNYFIEILEIEFI